jgi:hypothetical protein
MRQYWYWQYLQLCYGSANVRTIFCFSRLRAAANFQSQQSHIGTGDHLGSAADQNL